MHIRKKSETIFQELCKVLPGGVNSPIRACKAMGQLPLIAERGFEDNVFDPDGNSYIDYCCSWGALIHGHAHPVIIEAIQKRAACGTTFGIATPIEGALARKIIELMPSIEKIRFVSSGTEATMSASRLARAYTKRDIVIKFAGNYHGHADHFLVQAGSGVSSLPQASSAGIPEGIIQNTLSLPYNDSETFQKTILNPELRDRIAAVIVEPVAGNMGVVPGTQNFLETLRTLTHNIGALLIFDEVISGFRTGRGGAQAHYEIRPDLTCLGKIIGGGMPAAAFGGTREIMDLLAPLGTVYQAGTLSGNPLAMEAGLQALQLLEQPHFYEKLQEKTNALTLPIKEALLKKSKPACLQQMGSMFTLFFGRREVHNFEDALSVDLELYAKLFRYLFARGIYIPPHPQEAWFVSAAHHKNHLESTRDHILEFIEHELI